MWTFGSDSIAIYRAAKTHLPHAFYRKIDTADDELEVRNAMVYELQFTMDMESPFGCSY